MRLNDTAMQNSQALQWLLQRRSSRAFLPDAVPDDLLQQLLLAARRAPSGGNLQPGRLIAVQGRRRQQLTDALLQDFESQAPEQEDYAYFPRPMPMALRKRQVIAGFLRGDRMGAFWSVRSKISDYGLADALPCPDARSAELGRLATRLAAMPDDTQERLINWGYAICDAAMRRWVDHTLPPPAGFPYQRGV